MVSSPSAVHGCPHCGTLVEGPPGAYCCHGCASAAALVAEVGLSSWYTLREAEAPRSRVSTEVDWGRVPVSRRADGSCEARFDIQGLKCASCVWVTEEVLNRTPGVQDASVSYASGRARLRFDPARVSLATLAGRVALLGYRPRPAGAPDDGDRDLLLRLGVAAFCAMNVMGLYIALYAGWFDGMDERFAQLFRWMALMVATPAVVWSGAPFFSGAWQGLRLRVPHVDLPVALAIGLIYAHGVWATVAHEDAYLDSVTMLVALLLGGRFLEARGRRATAEAAASLAAHVPSTARRVTATGVEEVPTQALVVGDQVEVGVGVDVPADGVVVRGRGEVGTMLVTGEATPVAVAPGDAVVAGAVVRAGAITVAVTRTGDRTLVGRMARLMEETTEVPRAPSAADRLAPAFTLGTLVVATGTGAWMLAVATPAEALSRVAAVLVVACPCALALSRPLVGAAGLGATARRGLWLRDVDALERLALVDEVQLDKTGTVTAGRPVVVSGSDEALRLAAGLERASWHPVASAILEAAARRGVAVPRCDDPEEVVGQGVCGIVDGARWCVGAGGPGEVVVRSDGGVAHTIGLRDVPRAQVSTDVAALRALGCTVALVTGDRAEVAREIATSVGLVDVSAATDPVGKVERVRAAVAAGRRVLFVGDGLNDGPALAAATVGIAMSTGAPSSLLAADGVLVAERLGPLAEGIAVARRVRHRVRLNLVRSVLYNLAAVAGAVLGWVHPLTAAILMPLSSGLVIASAARLEGALRRR